METLSATSSGPLTGVVNVPGDKSITHRAMIFSAMADGISRIEKMCTGEDCLRTLDAIQILGVDVERKQQTVRVHGKGRWGFMEPSRIIDCGNSGTTMRLLAGLLAGQDFFSVLTGDQSLLQRPMGRIATPLRRMGAAIHGRKGAEFAPLAIQGTRLRATPYISPIASAQVKSAVLIAGLLSDGIMDYHEPHRSRDHTERMLASFGVPLHNTSETTMRLTPGPLNARDIAIPGDISAAAFFIVGALLVPGSDLIVRNVGLNPTRTGFLDILAQMGAGVDIANQREEAGEPVGDVRVHSSALTGVEIGHAAIVNAIDEFPILCVAAAVAHGTTRIRGAQELRVKESDRIAAMADALRRVGVEVEEFEDGLLIKGSRSLTGAECHSYGDHRVAMAMAMAGLVAKGSVTVTDVHCIRTSFPEFIDELMRVAPSCRSEAA